MYDHFAPGVDVRRLLFLIAFLIASVETKATIAQEQIDVLEKQKQAAAAIAQH